MKPTSTNANNRNNRYQPALYGACLALMISTFLLLFAGGMVTSTNSGLSVPDWPTTFGKNMFLFPPSMMKGGIFYEHGHRLFASLVGLLTVIIAVALFFFQGRRWLKMAGISALVLVIVQGVLGGMTVRYKLPISVSTAHACAAEIFFMLTVMLAFATSRVWGQVPDQPLRWNLPEQFLALGLCIVVFLQILVGAVMRHSYAGLAIPTFPSAFGELAPPFWNFGIVVNFSHTRVGASLVVLLSAALIVFLLRSKAQARGVKALALYLAMAVAAQCVLGMFTVWSGKAPVPTTFHLSIGALVFALAFLILLASHRLRLDGGANRSNLGYSNTKVTVAPDKAVPTSGALRA